MNLGCARNNSSDTTDKYYKIAQLVTKGSSETIMATGDYSIISTAMTGSGAAVAGKITLIARHSSNVVSAVNLTIDTANVEAAVGNGTASLLNHLFVTYYANDDGPGVTYEIWSYISSSYRTQLINFTTINSLSGSSNFSYELYPNASYQSELPATPIVYPAISYSFPKYPNGFRATELPWTPESLNLDLYESAYGFLTGSVMQSISGLSISTPGVITRVSADAWRGIIGYGSGTNGRIITFEYLASTKVYTWYRFDSSVEGTSAAQA